MPFPAGRPGKSRWDLAGGQAWVYGHALRGRARGVGEERAGRGSAGAIDPLRKDAVHLIGQTLRQGVQISEVRGDPGVVNLQLAGQLPLRDLRADVVPLAIQDAKLGPGKVALDGVRLAAHHQRSLAPQIDRHRAVGLLQRCKVGVLGELFERAVQLRVHAGILRALAVLRVSFIDVRDNARKFVDGRDRSLRFRIDLARTALQTGRGVLEGFRHTRGLVQNVLARCDVVRAYAEL